MESTDSNRQLLNLLRWLPLPFAMCFGILVFSLWGRPISLGYLLACGLVGTFAWALISIGYAHNHLNAALTICTFLVPPGLWLAYGFFSTDEIASSWRVFIQYGAMVYTVVLGLTLAFRARVIRSSAQPRARN
jgi:hypothetical protein